MENLVRHLRFDPQAELLHVYCSEVESLIMGTNDVTQAREIRDQVCERFRQRCNSSILVQATIAYADEIITRKWGTNSNGTDRTNDY